ncbi:histidine ammonia-lyase [Vicingus serpentipes]|uniref:Histidine ammonia-lyase n=1 Tax=Vicingus serpentipes TaxID=1926625 RepID=A0A5C6RTP3_9FLAO|nr:histidine ammonia-lyase [Vicingus serpentipes]TXB65344.1 histidine ammonia-lyase [Vicingus serpentipes]
MDIHYINKNWLTLEAIDEILKGNKHIVLSQEAEEAIVKCRAYLDEKLTRHEKPIYGINTGFGSLCNTEISKDDLEALQRNLVMSHACGLGKEVPQEVVKLMLLLKIQGISYGHSGVQLVTVQRLIDFYNNDVFPVVYEQGSLGASGDLAPLAHLSLPLLGLGEVNYQGKKITSEELNKKLGWKPISLQSKEGLALLNGTQFMSAYGIHSLLRAKKLSKYQDIVTAISLDAYDGRIEPFNDLIHKIRPHNGQFLTARNIKHVLKGSKIIEQEKAHVQDPYSFRCSPQVHGACKDAIAHVQQVFETEINSVTDNPTVFVNEDEVISAGNFHGQPLAMALDYLGIALAEIGSISERRTYKLIGGTRNLPPFLVANPGLNSGFMIPQYAQASVVSQNKQLATPCSVDTIDSSNGQEDHVSMGANAATKVYRMVDNVEKIIGVELLNAVQALEFRKPLKSSPFIQKVVSAYRKEISFVTDDIYMHPAMEKSIAFVKEESSKLSVKEFLVSES